MRNLSNDESSYVSSKIKSNNKSKRVFGIIALVITSLSIYSTLPQIMGADNILNLQNMFAFLIYGLFIVLGIMLLVLSFTTSGNGSIQIISGPFKEKTSSRRNGRTISYYIGKTRVDIPSAWISSLNKGQDYTVEMFKSNSRISWFTPLILSVQGMDENLAGISLHEGNNEEKLLIKHVKSIYFLYALAIVGPVLIIMFLMNLFFSGGQSNDVLNNNSDRIIQFFEYTDKHPFVGSLVKFFFENGITIFILLGVILVTVIVAKSSGKIDKTGRADISAMSWKNWLNEYSEFLENEFYPVMSRSNANDSSVIMDYRKTMNKHKLFRSEYKQFKKTLDSAEKSQFIQGFKDVEKQVRKRVNL